MHGLGRGLVAEFIVCGRCLFCPALLTFRNLLRLVELPGVFTPLPLWLVLGLRIGLANLGE